MSTRFGTGFVPAALRFNPKMTRFAAHAQRPLLDKPTQQPAEMAPWIESFLTGNSKIHVQNGDVFIRRDPAGETQLVGEAFKLSKPSNPSSDAFNVRFTAPPKVLEVENANGPVGESSDASAFSYQRPNHFLYPLSQADVEITPLHPEDPTQHLKKMTYQKEGRHHRLAVEYTDEVGRPHQRVLEHTAEIRRDAANPDSVKADAQAIEQVRDRQDPTGILHRLNQRLALTYLLNQPVPTQSITLPTLGSNISLNA